MLLAERDIHQGGVLEMVKVADRETEESDENHKE